MKQINWGIIGSGSIASAFAHSIQSTSNSKLIGLYGRNVDSTNAFAKKFNFYAYYQLNDLLSSPEEIDAVYVATPHSEHFVHTFQAIKNNKHVLLEKPITLKSEEVKIIAQAAKKNKKIVKEAFMVRHHPQWQWVKKYINSNKIGKVNGITTLFSYKNLDPKNIRNTKIHDFGGAGHPRCYFALFLRRRCPF